MMIFSFDIHAQERKTTLELFGFLMLDAGYNFNTIDPDWFDVMRPTKLPAYKNQFGAPGNVYFSLRQTRVGFRSTTPTRFGDLKTRFDFDLFGMGANAGHTTFHLVNAYAELGRIGVGQTASVFMDQEVFPATLDYWGPNSRTFFFNIQFRYIAIDNERERFLLALERPGATADGSDYREYLDLENVTPQFVAPNLTTHYRRITKWGHVQAGGVLKLMKWKDLSTTATPYSLSGHDIGWGTNLSAVVRTGNLLTVKMQTVYGEGIQNYLADAPADVGLQSSDDPGAPIKGKALPVWGLYLFTEWSWTEFLRSSIGYSWEVINNSDLQSPDAFRKGEYGLVNLRWYLNNDVMAGVEYQYGRRDNFSDGFHSTGSKLQISCKINFSSQLN